MATIDGSIVAVALPTMRVELSTGIGGAEWIVSAYLLTVSAVLLAAGRLGDEWGHRRLYLSGLGLFTLGSAACGLAPGLTWLVASRVLQALGAAAMMAIGPAVITAVFPAERRGRALGAIASVVAVGLSAGPPLGGFLVQHLSWRWIFFVNLPVGLAGAIWAARALPETARPQGKGLDLPGAGLLALAVGGLVGAVKEAPRAGGRGAALLLGALLAAALLARRSRRVPAPVLDLSLFERRSVAVGTAAALLSYASFFTASVLNPFFLGDRKGLSPQALGAMMTLVPVALSVASPLAGWLADRFPSRALAPAGTALLAAGLAGLSTQRPEGSLVSFGACQLALGMGMGLFQTPNSSAVMGALPRTRLGAGGGLLATARNLGMVLGIATAGTVFRRLAGAGTDEREFLAGYAAALRAGALLGVAAGLVALLSGAPERPATSRPS
jgi:EmrB/QacA subfamily drug resistance transporter